jgi:DNA replication protein DnaC
METKKDLSVQEVISTDQELLCSLQNDAQEMINIERKRTAQRRQALPLAYADFRELFSEFGTYCLLSRNKNAKFIFDSNNEPIIEQLFYYATCNPLFCGDLNKGIMLQGKFGCGKSIVFETYSLIHNQIAKKSFIIPILSFIKSMELQERIIQQSNNPFLLRPIIIDEFGREPKTVQYFGNILRPVSELLFERSDVGAITHGTTNFTLETLSSDDFYGSMIGDRLKMMFNFITLKGNSRRK